jgi:hypothetical protein
METHARGGDLTAAANLLPELEANIQSLLAALGISPVAQSAAQPIAQSDAVESPER